jgi:hypothetical protein
LSHSSFYRHSGQFPSWTIPAFLGLSCLLLPLGFLYQFILNIVPYVKLKFFIFALFLILLNIFGAWLIRVFKVRSLPVSVLSGAILGAALAYWSWVAWIYMYGETGWVFHPDALFKGMQARASQGAWVKEENTLVVGFEAWSVWVGEFLLLSLTPAMGTFVALKNSIFCEKCRCWLVDGRQIGPYEASPSTHSTIEEVIAGRKEALWHLTLAEGLQAEQVEGDVFSCPKCGDFHTLRLSQTPVIKGATTRKHVLLTGLLLTSSEVADLWDRSHAHLPGRSP